MWCVSDDDDVVDDHLQDSEIRLRTLNMTARVEARRQVVVAPHPQVMKIIFSLIKFDKLLVMFDLFQHF